MDIKYYVRTTNERVFDYSPLEYEILVDTNHDACKHFMDTLNYAKNQNAVILEDDLILCNNFKDEAESVIKTYPNAIINFFTAPNMFFTTHFTNAFSYNQCTYFPKSITSMVYDEMSRLYAPTIRHYGPLLERALNNLGIASLVYRPCLVQHKDIHSLLEGRAGKNRQSIYFKDYLDKLHIDYTDAFTNDNRAKLTNLLLEDKNIWGDSNMSNELQQNLNSILSQKNSYLKPDNIKKV